MQNSVHHNRLFNNLIYAVVKLTSGGKDIVFQLEQPEKKPQYPSPLKNNKMQKEDLIQYIPWRAQHEIMLWQTLAAGAVVSVLVFLTFIRTPRSCHCSCDCG